MVETSSEAAFAVAEINLRGAIEDGGAIVTHDPLPVVMADETQLVELFQNLISNGIKYRGEAAPEVHVSAVPDGTGRWEFSITDNGVGIDPEYHERIFGMFQRLHGRDHMTGTGIGLAIAKKIVERHGGSISVESRLGAGSTFRYTLGAAGRAP